MRQPITYPLNCSGLDRLPLFATDREIAVALVGRERAGKWLRERLPVIAAQRGFPPIDAFHGGRAVPLVRIFYQRYLSLVGDFPGVPDGEERPEVWTKGRKEKS